MHRDERGGLLADSLENRLRRSSAFTASPTPERHRRPPSVQNGGQAQGELGLDRSGDSKAWRRTWGERASTSGSTTQESRRFQQAQAGAHVRCQEEADQAGSHALHRDEGVVAALPGWRRPWPDRVEKPSSAASAPPEGTQPILAEALRRLADRT